MREGREGGRMGGRGGRIQKSERERRLGGPFRSKYERFRICWLVGWLVV